MENLCTPGGSCIVEIMDLCSLMLSHIADHNALYWAGGQEGVRRGC